MEGFPLVMIILMLLLFWIYIYICIYIWIYKLYQVFSRILVQYNSTWTAFISHTYSQDDTSMLQVSYYWYIYKFICLGLHSIQQSSVAKNHGNHRLLILEVRGGGKAKLVTASYYSITKRSLSTNVQVIIVQWQ